MSSSLKQVLDFMLSEERNVRVQSLADGGGTIMMGDSTYGFSDSLQVEYDDLDSGAATFLDLYLALEGNVARLRWLRFQSKLRANGQFETPFRKSQLIFRRYN